MRKMDNSADDEEQLVTWERNMNLPGHDSVEAISMEPRDYRALLAMTRPLVIAKQPPLSLRVPINRDKAISLEKGDFRAEFTLKKGKILYPGLPGQGMERDEGLTTTGERAGRNSAPEGEYDVAGEFISALPQTGSNLKIRIYLGMS